MQAEFLGQNGEMTETARTRAVVRVGLALLLGCALVVSGISGPTNAPRSMADMFPSPESSRECPAGESDEEESNETESILASKGSNRRHDRRPSCSPLHSKANIKQHKAGFSFLSQPAAPTGELANRNGVGAPLRC